MGGSGTQNNYDPVLNAGILALSEAGFDISKEYDNFYKYGVLYDPNEQGFVDPTTGEWTSLEEAGTITVGLGSNKQTVPNIPAGANVTTRGASEGYDFENPPDSYMKMEGLQTSSNIGLIDSATQAGVAQNIYDKTAAETQTWQSLIDLGLSTGINPITGQQVGPGALQVGSSEQNLSIASNQAATRNVPYSEAAAREDYLTQTAQSQSNRAIIPSSERAAISSNEYQTALNQAQQGMISPWTESVLSDYEYNKWKNKTEQALLEDYGYAQQSGYQYETAKNQTEQALLPAYQKATQSGYDLSYAQNTADTELMPYYQSAAQAGYEASEAGSNYSKGKSEADIALLPAYQKAAQAEYDLSYDTSKYGQNKIAGQTPIMNKYFEKVNQGVDVGGRVNEASADVASSWKGANQRTNMALESMGVDPSSARGRDAFSKSNMEYGRQQTTARQTARRQAEDEDMSRMQTALSM